MTTGRAMVERDPGGLGELVARLRLMMPFHTSPRRIALGVSIGLFVAFSPTIGFQMGLALVIAWVLNASRPAAIASVWVTNPWTMGPLYAFTYVIGRPFWSNSHDIALAELSQTIRGAGNGNGIDAVFRAFHNTYSLGADVLIPMLIGGAILGVLAGFLGYFPTQSVASFYQRSRRRKTRPARRGTSGVSRHVAPEKRVDDASPSTTRRSHSKHRNAA